MALRFRRSIKLAPGLRLHLSGGGASLTVGPRGASVNFGSRGAFLNSGIPGTGLYSRSRLGGAPSRAAAQPGKVSVSATIRVEDDGTVKYLDANGQPLNDYLTNLAKRQHGAKIKGMLAETSERINAEVEVLGKLHHFTPRPDETPTRAPREFENKQPEPPVPRKIGLLARLLGKRAEIEAENAENERIFGSDLSTPAKMVRQRVDGRAPELALVDQFGQPLTLAELRGKVVLLTFTYSSCADVCPLITAAMAALQQRLTAAERQQVFFLSVTTDPEVDTPAVLHAYATRLGADLASWAFLTGHPQGRSGGVAGVRADGEAACQGGQWNIPLGRS